jgi:hypothetical protein
MGSVGAVPAGWVGGWGLWMGFVVAARAGEPELEAQPPGGVKRHRPPAPPPHPKPLRPHRLHLPAPPPRPPVVAIKGNFLLGLNFLIIQLYPMRPGATMMSSFLVNVALILAMSSAVTQFCASAFASYASNTIIFEIFGNDVSARRVGAVSSGQPPGGCGAACSAAGVQGSAPLAPRRTRLPPLRPLCASSLLPPPPFPPRLSPPCPHPCTRSPPQVLYLKGLRYIYQFNVFLYMMLSIAGVSTLWMIVKGAGGPWKRKKPGGCACVCARRRGGAQGGETGARALDGAPGKHCSQVGERNALPEGAQRCSLHAVVPGAACSRGFPQAPAAPPSRSRSRTPQRTPTGLRGGLPITRWRLARRTCICHPLPILVLAHCQRPRLGSARPPATPRRPVLLPSCHQHGPGPRSEWAPL